MTQWAPVWRVKIDGTDVTDSVLANLSITSGRTNIYEQAQAGYCSVTLIIFGQAALPYEINDTISIEVQDTSAAYVPIFGGSVVDIAVSVSQVGSSAYTQEVTITALGALARLQKALTNGVLSHDFDGDQIETILKQVLFAQWQNSDFVRSQAWMKAQHGANFATNLIFFISSQQERRHRSVHTGCRLNHEGNITFVG